MWSAACLAALYLLLLIPSAEREIPLSTDAKPFAWNSDEFWRARETQFRDAKARGCDPMREELSRDFEVVRLLARVIELEGAGPGDGRWVSIESTLFRIAPLVAACPERLLEQAELFSTVRSVVKRQSTQWDLTSPMVRERLYRLLYGGRAAVEESLLQAPRGAVPALIADEPVSSRTPSAVVHGLRVHSGDLLVSRGGAPTSALIARGNDFPGNFSHIALVHVDAGTGKVSIVEAHIEAGLLVSSIDDYLDGKKLRVMVLRLRPDLPAIAANPMLPHEAASEALKTAQTMHVPYDFDMNYRDPSKQFCSEVASAAYARKGITLWAAMSHISSPGLRSWLGAFGVRHFETQEPADLEYDPQLSVVAEWRDLETLFQDHADNAVVDALLERAEAGDRLGYPRWKLPLARVTKGFSALQNALGWRGLIPEGMSASTALRYEGFNERHQSIRDRVLTGASAFEERNSYRPPYWELVRLARAAI